MRVLVKYIDFHWDNYQGGSGQTVNSSVVIELQDSLYVREVFDEIHSQLKAHILVRRPFPQDRDLFKTTIVSMELL